MNVLIKFIHQAMIPVSHSARWLSLALAMTLSGLTPLLAEGPKQFTSPEEAVAGLAAATKTQDPEQLRPLFGSAAAEFVNPDRVQATNEFAAFSAALAEGHRLVPESENRYVLEVGQTFWPFPIPIIRREGRWFFDGAAGKEEIWNRRIGKNELAVLELMRTYVDAQQEYAGRDRDDDEVLEYAQRLASSPGTRDGLFWPPELDGSISPLGPLVAEAQAQGYSLNRNSRAKPEPFHGYYFKILTQQAKHAPGGKYNYIINGNMIAGFALIAWPAEYGESGIMTFVVNQQGRVYQRDLGKDTAKKAAAIKAYDPDPKWRISKE